MQCLQMDLLSWTTCVSLCSCTSGKSVSPFNFNIHTTPCVFCVCVVRIVILRLLLMYCVCVCVCPCSDIEAIIDVCVCVCSDIEAIIDVCVCVCVHAVIEGDYATCMQHLMHFPTVYEVNYLIQRSLHLRNPVRKGLLWKFTNYLSLSQSGAVCASLSEGVVTPSPPATSTPTSSHPHNSHTVTNTHPAPGAPRFQGKTG